MGELMFLILPDKSRMHLAQHGTRDESMTYAVVGRISPSVEPGHAWGLFGCARSEAAANLKAKRLRAKNGTAREFVTLQIQHGFDPY